MSASERDEERCKPRAVLDETTVRVNHATGAPDLALGSTVWVMDYCFVFGFMGPYTLVIYHATEEGHVVTA